MRNSIIASVTILMLLVIPFASLSMASYSEADSSDKVLIDLGNGKIYWSDAETGTYGKAIEAAATSWGLDISTSGGLTIEGLSSRTSPVSVDWKIYTWDGSSWKHRSDLSLTSAYSGGVFAVGFYSSGSITPVATPDNPYVWTTYGGSSSASGVSTSPGLEKPSAPAEWFNTYSTGYVDSGLVIADDLLYHTTGGAFGAGGTDKNPWMYCVNRHTGEEKWKYMMDYGSGYEVTTPLIIGDLIVVNSTSGKMYCFDRYTGELLDVEEIPFKPPMSPSGDISWNGRTFVTGGTTPVYDSGALFFGSADGKVYCYTVTRDTGFEMKWRYEPQGQTIGCFYFHAPTISEVNGKRMLFMGNYSGYVHAIDIGTGNAAWTKQVVNFGADNKPHPGTPGSAASISISPDNKVLLIGCSDGGMSSLAGYLLALDPATGKGMGGSAELWRLDALFTSPVTDKDGFYSYVSQSDTGSRTFTTVDGDEVDIIPAVYKFDWSGNVIWTSQKYQLIKGPLTLAGGILYGIDYSSGAFWPTGGGLTAIDADDGSEVWRILLRPFTVDSYSMVQATVVDGKVYAANDFGAVYCVSTTAGPNPEGTDISVLETVGFKHWSWVVLAVFVAGVIFLFVRYY